MADVMTHLWFGWTDRTAGGFFQWAPAPLRGISVSNAGYSEGMVFENGGRSRVRSARYSKVYTITAVGASKDIDGYAVYNKAASGFYGVDRLWKFPDYYAFETNLFPAGWSEPAKRESDWYNTGVSEPIYSSTATNSYNQPTRKATFTIATASGATPLTDSTIPYVDIPIPPTHTLHLGCTGAATGTAVVRVESWVNGAVAAGATTDLTLLSETGSTRLNATVSGATYNWARVFYTRTSSAASTLTPISLMAQLWTTGITPTLTGNHLMGEGHTQLQFADDAIVEDYEFIYPPRKGISTTLEEVVA
jgi:hypothetical protein